MEKASGLKNKSAHAVESGLTQVMLSPTCDLGDIPPPLVAVPTQDVCQTISTSFPDTEIFANGEPGETPYGSYHESLDASVISVPLASPSSHILRRLRLTSYAVPFPTSQP